MAIEHDYEVTPGALFAVLVDPEFLAARGARFGGGAGAAEVDRRGDAVVVTTPRQLSMDMVPAAFRGFAGSGRLVQVDTWTVRGEDSITATWTADAGGAPLSLTGTHDIAAMPGGCRYAVTTRVDLTGLARFAGGGISGMVTNHLEELVRREQHFAADWLAGGR